ncbi:hypothetical protein DYD21_05980 [Rhodohalobacter sp. SW132]|uniref:hypothetical protein n=1 Tax=Rhodohalobacter sp. SW132 TaxID=2293433 RepID=UPI000E268DAC|nr:hypothetical protein [Rhodohalobacter sp. SW132]REL38156.1 hypothetical protein DYD21_05980 [Rhodohalobacter sp. SW132]
MFKKLYLLLPVIAVFALVQCETPGSPDFTLSNKIDSPLIAESTFRFLGDSNALIDTTNENFKNLFTIDGDDLITISQEEDFDFGDLDGAIPVVRVNPTMFQSSVGEIELEAFSSQNENGNVGEASFTDLTGQTAELSEGQTLPGASSPFPVNIELETDFFVSATIRQGSLDISLRNELGFDLLELSLEVFSGNESLGTILIPNFEHGSTRSDLLAIVENPETEPDQLLEDLNADIEITWEEQDMSGDAGSMIIDDIRGENLIATSVNAVISSQEFSSDGSAEFSDEEFQFNSTDHYVELSSGTLSVQHIVNSIDVDIDLLEISFPGLRLPPYGVADSLTIRFDGENRIPRNNTTPVSRSFDLNDVRIYADDNLVKYNIFAQTEDTQASEGSDSRTLHESDEISAEVELTDLEIREVFGVIVNRQVLLNTEISADGTGVDIMNDLEAERIEIDGIDDLSKKVEGIEFTRASLDINYLTNVGVPTTIIGAFLGVDADGNEFFLQGEPGTETEVTAADPTQMLLKDGSPIAPSNLIKFKLDPGQSSDELLSNVFDRENSSITQFLNRLPTSIRFIGLADINPEQTAGIIRNPVIFDPSISLNIPLALRAENATYVDTTAVNLEDLPGADDEQFLEEGAITVRYSNRIPLGINLEMEFLTENGELITTLPLHDQSALEFLPAAVNGSGFSVDPNEDYTVISLTRAQLDEINRTRNVRLIAGLNTTDFKEVRVRTSDDVGVSVSGKFVIQNKID